MENMNVFSYDGVVPPGDWKVSRLYTVLVFEKEEELSSNIPFSQPEPMPPTYSYNHYRFFIPSSPDYAFDAQDSVGDATAIENRGVEDFQPQSPDFPPESNFMPTTPDYAPEEEEHKVKALVPTSPDYNPYENNDDQDHYIVPTSPDYNPEEEASASSSVTQNWGQKDDAMLSKEKEDPPDEESEMLLRLLQVRNRAVELAGGQHRWDLLTEEEADIFMEQATALHSSAHGGAVIVPSSPDFPPPSESDPFCPTSPDFPPPEDDTVIPKSPDSSPPPETSNSTGRFAWNSVSSWD